MKSMTSYGCGVAEGNEIYNVREQNVLFPVNIKCLKLKIIYVYCLDIYVYYVYM